MEKIVCIYKIQNIITGDIYVGSAINFKKRIARHKMFLRKNKHHSRYLQNAFNQYGEPNFSYSVIEPVIDICTLLDREQYWINTLHPVYNTMRDVKSHIGVKRSDETRQKMAAAQIGKKHSTETKAKLRDIFLGGKHSEITKIKRAKKAYKSIIQIDRHTNEIIKEWESATIAATTLGVSRMSIYESANNRKQPFKDFVWRYKITKQKHENKYNRYRCDSRQVSNGEST